MILAIFFVISIPITPFTG